MNPDTMDIVVPGGSGEWHELRLPFSIPAGPHQLTTRPGSARERAVSFTGPARHAYIYIQASPGEQVAVELIGRDSRAVASTADLTVR